MSILLNISKKYGDRVVLQDLKLGLGDGKITCILGESGCGKTTILNCIAGLVPYGGSITGRPESVSYIFQNFRLLENLTVRGNLEYVLAGLKLSDKSERISRALEGVELTEAENLYPSELSGGMAQRVGIARGFVYPSGLLLMDEPFQALDMALKYRVMRQFLGIWEADGRTAVFVTHLIDEALMLADRIVLLGKGGEILGDFSMNFPQRGRLLSDSRVGEVRSEIFAKLGI